MPHRIGSSILRSRHVLRYLGCSGGMLGGCGWIHESSWVPGTGSHVSWVPGLNCMLGANQEEEEMERWGELSLIPLLGDHVHFVPLAFCDITGMCDVGRAQSQGCSSGVWAVRRLLQALLHWLLHWRLEAGARHTGCSVGTQD